MATSDIVKNAYDMIGVANPDAEGVAYWTEQLNSGAITPAQFQSAFLGAAAGVDVTAAPELAAAVTAAQQMAPVAQQNYATQLTTEQYRNLFGRNPEQEGYQYWMSRLESDLTTDQLRNALIAAAQGIDPALYANLGQDGGYTDINVPALEADPYAGRYATQSIYDIAPDAVNISDIAGRQAQFVTPVGQMPGVSTYVDGVYTYAPGEYTLNPDQLMGQMGVALQSGALSQEGYNTMLYDIAAAQDTNQLMDAFNRAQAEINMNTSGVQTGVNGAPVDFGNIVQSAYQGMDTRATQPNVVTPENMGQQVTQALGLLQREFGQPIDLTTNLSPGYYSERGFETGYTPMGEGPMFRSGVAGYTPNLPSGFQFGVVPVSAAIPTFTPGTFNANATGYDQFGQPIFGDSAQNVDQTGSYLTNPIIGRTPDGTPIYAATAPATNSGD